jgi:hypothetical protein
VPKEGIEPSRFSRALGFESSASANSATSAKEKAALFRAAF